MATVTGTGAMTGTSASDPAAATMFQEEWQVYRKVVDNNYLFHREAYGALHEVLAAETAPFRLLDVACGDASATVGALAGTRVSAYQGIDLSDAALALAATTLATLPCPVMLTRRNFVDALREPGLSADVAWIGLSLHHLRQPEKLALMRDTRRIVGTTGKLLLYENTSPGPETRDAWMTRWDRQRPDWIAFSDREWDAITSHVHANDHPETDAAWLQLGTDAGFGRARCLYASPTELFRLYSFDA